MGECGCHVEVATQTQTKFETILTSTEKSVCILGM